MIFFCNETIIWDSTEYCKYHSRNDVIINRLVNFHLSWNDWLYVRWLLQQLWNIGLHFAEGGWLHCEDHQALEQVTQRDCMVFVFGAFWATWSVTKWPPDISSGLNYSMNPFSNVPSGKYQFGITTDVSHLSGNAYGVI